MAFPPHHHLRGFIFHPHDNSDQISSPRCSPPFYQGGGPFAMMKRSMSFSGADKCDEEAMMNAGEDEISDNESQLGEKKKRLNMEQVKALEKSFELGNKLEPERKMQLARALGLQPRQIAIWFQNRRARWKTKQLERDYETLKKQVDSLKADNESLETHNKRLRSQLIALKARESQEINAVKEADQGSWSNGSENSCEVNLNVSTKDPMSGSPVSSRLSMNHLLPSSSSARFPSMTQLLHGSTRQNNQVAHQENFCTIFNNSGEHQGLWPWPEQLASFSLNQSHYTQNE